jgi:hypothetical protein
VYDILNQIGPGINIAKVGVAIWGTQGVTFHKGSPFFHILVHLQWAGREMLSENKVYLESSHESFMEDTMLSKDCENVTVQGNSGTIFGWISVMTTNHRNEPIHNGRKDFSLEGGREHV